MYIAEIGINHEGSEQKADAMLHSVVSTSIDAVTFQIPSKDYLNSQEPKRRPLSNAFYKQAIKICNDFGKKIGFACSDIELINFLDSYGADFWKTLSIDLSDEELLKKYLKTGKTTFISTGISGMDEIRKISFLNGEMKFIHTQISNKIEDVNLKAIDNIRSITGKDVAFGHHCLDERVLYLSAVFEPSDIFFYVKSTKSDNYPDGPHAIVINDINRVLNDIISLRKSVGDGSKNKFKPKWN